MELVQLKWPAPDEGDDCEICRYSLEEGILTVKTLSREVVSPKIKDSAVLRETLLANRDNPDLFEKPNRYRRFKD
ncbi:MAG: hypothetical protein ISR85_03605 [Kiritimatiellales bacterium]|nr:hypothetical protein [Kiritimatiellota bacterium]MBL7011998.1 hypothetical protein [Kiritimatiellales bacterium]